MEDGGLACRRLSSLETGARVFFRVIMCMLQTGLNCADAEKHKMEHIQACEEIWRDLENLKRLVAPHMSTIPQQAQFTRNVTTILTRLKQHPDEFIEEIQWLIKMATLAFEQLAGDPPVQGNTSNKVVQRRGKDGRYLPKEDAAELAERPSPSSTPERWKQMPRVEIFGEVVVSLVQIAVPLMFAIVLMFAAGNTLLVGMIKFQEHVAANGLKNREVRQQMVRAAQIGAEALAGALNDGGSGLSALATGANLAIKSSHEPRVTHCI